MSCSQLWELFNKFEVIGWVITEETVGEVNFEGRYEDNKRAFFAITGETVSPSVSLKFMINCIHF